MLEAVAKAGARRASRRTKSMNIKRAGQKHAPTSWAAKHARQPQTQRTLGLLCGPCIQLRRERAGAHNAKELRCPSTKGVEESRRPTQHAPHNTERKTQGEEGREHSAHKRSPDRKSG
eukprot:6214677-Pleurochrysis_carterae.AAC.2